MIDLSSGFIFFGLIGIPLLSMVFLGLTALLDISPQEKIVIRILRIVMISHLLVVSYCLKLYFETGGLFHVSIGKWYVVEHYAFDLNLLFDKVSLPILFVMSFLLNIVGYFCTRYLHRDKGFYRFCLLYLMFSVGISIVVSAGTVDLLFAGWELLGMSSALLIGFYHDRAAPPANGLYTFIYYRICDVALLFGAVLWHHFSHSSDIPTGVVGLENVAPGTSENQLTLIAVVFIVASLAKSSQFPLNSWLPKSMEGPTPSSAIFYGALSIHAGAYLLLRMYPLIQSSDFAGYLIVGIGIVSALIGSFVGRAKSDVKSMLAYSAMAQLGIIYIEIGLGWTNIAIAHIIGHSLLRSLQFLRSPTVLHDFHQIGHEPLMSGFTKIERVFPQRIRNWAYFHILAAEISFDSILKVKVSRVVMLIKKSITKKICPVSRVDLRKRRSH